MENVFWDLLKMGPSMNKSWNATLQFSCRHAKCNFCEMMMSYPHLSNLGFPYEVNIAIELLLWHCPWNTSIKSSYLDFDSTFSCLVDLQCLEFVNIHMQAPHFPLHILLYLCSSFTATNMGLAYTIEYWVFRSFCVDTDISSNETVFTENFLRTRKETICLGNLFFHVDKALKHSLEAATCIQVSANQVPELPIFIPLATKAHAVIITHLANSHSKHTRHSPPVSYAFSCDNQNPITNTTSRATPQEHAWMTHIISK